MIGRGTRQCENLFGPGRDKECFSIFDWRRNLEFFNENPGKADGAVGDPLSKRLFDARVALIGQIDAAPTPDDDKGKAVMELRSALASALRGEVRGMNPENCLVRPNRRSVEKFSAEEAWSRLDADARQELTDHVAGLPTSVTGDDLASKQFDLTIYRSQLALLQADAAFAGRRSESAKPPRCSKN